MQAITPGAARQALERAEWQLLDVREQSELDIAALPGAVHVPLSELPGQLERLDPHRPVLVLCHHGIRSAMAGQFLERNGFEMVLNLEGGIDAWSLEVDPDLPRY